MLAPGDNMLAKISYDGSERPGFVGNLAVEVTALASDHTEILRFSVLAEIVPEGEVAFCTEEVD